MNRTSSLFVGAVAGLLAGCTGSEAALNNPGAANQVKPAESISRLGAPSDRSQVLEDKLDLYRRQTFADMITANPGTSVRATHNNVLYTAAYRHAIYLNGVNCASWRPGATGLPPGAPGSVLTAASTYTALRGEPAVPTVTGTFPDIFPALYTNPQLYGRVAAVVGSPNIFQQCAPQGVNEFYVFNGDVRTEADADSAFRGFNRDGQYNSFTDYTQYGPVDDVWYTVRGRTQLMRAGLKWFSFASVFDTAQGGDCICPPWPLFYPNYNRFLGALNTAVSSPYTNALGFWPNNGNVDVNPYGLDTDVPTYTTLPAGLVRSDVFPSQYTGVPIHITIPTAEPFLLNATYPVGLQVFFRRVAAINATAADGGVALPTGNPDDVRFSPYYTVLWAGLNPSSGGSLIPAGGVVGLYEPMGSSRTSDVGDGLRNGEMFIIPASPLVPNSFYQVGVRLLTATYALPTPSSGDEVFVWNFRTNGNVPQ